MLPAGQTRHLYTVILAAGGSRRLGQPKQLLKIHRERLLERAVRIAHEVTPRRVVLVLGAQRLRNRLLLKRRFRHLPRIVHNGRWRAGMASSLHRGLSALPRGCRAALLLVIDQPGVTSASLEQLTWAWRNHPGQLVAAHYGGQPGVPAILPRRYWRAVKGLAGDQGARWLLRAQGQSLITVPMPEAAWDIDSPADLTGL